MFDLDGKLLGLHCDTFGDNDPLHTSAALIIAHWDDLVVGKNLDRLRLFSQRSVHRQRTEFSQSESEPTHGEEGTAIAVARAKAASVRISDIGAKVSLVSGVIVTPDGYVITCGHHGRMPGEKMSLSLHDGRTANATVLGANLVSDVGVLKITDAGTWPHAEMGHSTTTRWGDDCVLIGYPAATSGREPWVFTTQIIKPKWTLVTLPRRDDWYCRFWTSGFPQPIGGTSGGGVFDAQGHVIGVLLGGTVQQQMRHARVELFRKNWSALTANKPVQVVGTKLLAETTASLNRVAVELSAEDRH